MAAATATKLGNPDMLAVDLMSPSPSAVLSRSGLTINDQYYIYLFKNRYCLALLYFSTIK